MNKLAVLLIPAILTVLISGCTSSQIPMSVALDISDNLTATSLKFWSGYANALSTNPSQGLLGEKVTSFSKVCPIHDYPDEVSKSYGMKAYYINECDFSKINELRNSDNSTDREAYFSLSAQKAGLAIANSTYSTFNEIYTEEDKSSVDRVVTNIVYKTYDIAAMVPVISSQGMSWRYLSSKLYNSCNKSTTCIDSFLAKVETATNSIVSETQFDDNYVSFCENELKNSREFNEALDIIRKTFKEKGYDIDLNKYGINARSLCQRNRLVYSSIYQNALSKTSDPMQRFYIATVFYSLNKNTNDTQLTSYLDNLTT